jgi:hypothetical protein
MQCSIEEAFSMFFAPWQDRGTELLLAVDGGFDGANRCKVVTISPGSRWYIEIEFTRSERKTTLDIGAAASFSYDDWRAGLFPEAMRRKWAHFLLVEFADGRRWLFAEPLLGAD